MLYFFTRPKALLILILFILGWETLRNYPNQCVSVIILLTLAILIGRK